MYPEDFIEQYKFLLNNIDFFKTFGEFSEPYEDKIIAKAIEEYKDKPLREKLRAPFKIISNYFRPLNNVPVEHIYSVKEMEDKKIRGACSEFALLTAAILRKLDFPVALLGTIDIKNVFQPNESLMSDHVVNLVYDGNKWWLIDSTKKRITRFISLRIFEDKYIPALIFRDFADLNIRDRRTLYYKGLKNVKEYLLLDLQEDILADFIDLNNI
ncbi:hypothetical protein YN1_8150 [Nanoarchaeota archaeon]